jgi:hypothetical protein
MNWTPGDWRRNLTRIVTDAVRSPRASPRPEIQSPKAACLPRCEISRLTVRAAALVFLTLWLASALAGCVTKGQAKAQARAAYLAGQQETLTRLQQAQAQGPSVRINGPVRNPVVPWTRGLTLMKAIVAAEYQGASDPAEIILLHRGLARRLDVKQLLDGEDVPLEPGDVVQLVPSQPKP